MTNSRNNEYGSSACVQMNEAGRVVRNKRMKILRVVSLMLLTSSVLVADELLQIKVNGNDLIGYQAEPLSNPKGGDKFYGSDFIHPLKTPAGFVLTDIQPDDHLHHFGLWWPWKYVETQGRKVLCWELQEGEGLILAQTSSATENGFIAKSIYIDRKAPGGAKTLINETVEATVSDITDAPARGYLLDIKITHQVAGNEPLAISQYRYSGFAIRGTEFWNKDNSTLLTSYGKDRDTSNGTRSKWVRVQGDAGDNKEAGFVMMSHKDNHDYPEKLRTWDSKQQNGAIFINFNSVQDAPWVFEPGREYIRNYRLFVYDGTVTPEQAEELSQQYNR